MVEVETVYRKVISRWAGHSVLQELESIFDSGPLSPRLGWGFKTGLYPQLRDLDSRIPGVGMHYVMWKGSTPHFPFPGRRFDGVIRGLRYVPYCLASPNVQMLARFIADVSGAHVEQCVKTVRGTGRKPLGSLVRQRNVRRRLGEELARDVQEYVPFWNEAKHVYETGLPDSVVPIRPEFGGSGGLVGGDWCSDLGFCGVRVRSGTEM